MLITEVLRGLCEIPHASDVGSHLGLRKHDSDLHRRPRSSFAGPARPLYLAESTARLHSHSSPKCSVASGIEGTQVKQGRALLSPPWLVQRSVIVLLRADRSMNQAGSRCPGRRKRK